MKTESEWRNREKQLLVENNRLLEMVRTKDSELIQLNEWKKLTECYDPVATAFAVLRMRDLPDFQELQDDIASWARDTFHRQSINGILAHLARELGELLEEPDDPLEWADCFMLLMDAAALMGYSMRDIYEALKLKLEINKTRTWGDMQPDGTIEHDRQTLGGA